MRVNNALILSAGFGTRMGLIGSVLPKPIWPLFEKSLLESVVLQLKSLGIQNFFVNLHHQSEQVREKLNLPKSLGINFIFEKDILGTGGSISNVLNLLNKEEVLLTANADSLFLAGGDDIKRATEELDSCDSILFAVQSKKSFGHNELVLDKNKHLININKGAARSENFVTYSGMGLFKRDANTKASGFQDLWTGIGNYRKKKIKVISVPEAEYYDFGTKELYYNFVNSIVKDISINKQSSLLKLLTENKIIDISKLKGDGSYNSSYPGCINFSGDHSRCEYVGIILAGSPIQKTEVGELGNISYYDLNEQIHPPV